jgi:hypothetical protein
VGDIVVVKESGAHEARPIETVDTTPGSAYIEFAIPLDNGAPSDNVVLSKVTMYLTGNSHPSLALSYYWGNEILQKAGGNRVTSMSLDNWTTGQVASFNFGTEGLNYDEVDGAAPHTPSYDSGIPPLILSACVWKDDTKIDINSMTLSVTNTIGFTTSTCSPSGKSSARLTSREISGSINPYKDDTSTEYFDDFEAGTEFSLFAYAYNPSSTTGEIDMGSVVALWLPQVVLTEFQTQDLEGLLVDQLSFRATRGSAGSSEEMYIGLI